MADVRGKNGREKGRVSKRVYSTMHARVTRTVFYIPVTAYKLVHLISPAIIWLYVHAEVYVYMTFGKSYSVNLQNFSNSLFSGIVYTAAQPNQAMLRKF